MKKSKTYRFSEFTLKSLEEIKNYYNLLDMQVTETDIIEQLIQNKSCEVEDFLNKLDKLGGTTC